MAQSRIRNFRWTQDPRSVKGNRSREGERTASAAGEISPDGVRMGEVMRLRALIAAGTYRISSAHLADSLMSYMLLRG